MALPEDTQPYLQHKAELEDEERRRHEMDAREARYEMNGEDTMHEIGTGGDRRISALQELKGPEHSKELEGHNYF